MELTEILNKDTLAVVVGQSEHQADHGPLMKALRSRYPEWEFKLVADRGSWSSVNKRLVSAEGKIVSDDFEAWITAEVEASGNNPRAVWEKYKDAGLVQAEWQGSTVYVAAPYGPEPDAYFQIEVDVKHETTARYAFETDSWCAPDCLRDLIQPMTDLAPEREISPWGYELRQIIDIRRFVREMVSIYEAERQARMPEMKQKTIRQINIGEEHGSCHPQEIPFLEMYPDWPTWKHPIARIIHDWHDSSAGQNGRRFCHHWFLQLSDYTDQDGVRYMSAIPQWADGDRGLDLPELFPNEDESPLAVFSTLSDFDEQVGYPFAWYFYMLHGNRIGPGAGVAIARGIGNCSIWIPEKDERVILRWYGRQYGF